MTEFVKLVVQDPDYYDEPDEWIVRTEDISHVEIKRTDWGIVYFRNHFERARDICVYQEMAELRALLTE